MFSPRRRPTAVAVLSAAVLGSAVPVAQAAPPPPGPSSAVRPVSPGPSSTPGPGTPSARTAAGQEARRAAAYWTARRMAAARPLDDLRSAAPAPHRPANAVAAIPQGTKFGGTRLVGTFFGSGGPDGTDWTCTGSVLDTAARNVILTAAHCGRGIGSNYIFVPRFVKGAGPDQQPYGIFHIQRMFIDPRYVPDKGSSTTKTPLSDLDTAFARVSANQRGQQLQDAVGGGLTFTRPGGYSNKNVTVVGYPARKYGNDAGQAVKCTVPTTQLPGYRQMSMTCGGYYGGVSGSPWITDYRDDAGTGHVIGNLGGYNGGGNDANVDYVSYAPAFGADAANLLADAVADRTPPSGLPPYRGVPGKLPGGAALWQHARLFASGDYTGDHRGDLIVVWSDGEVTLYPGDGKGGFLPEVRLRAAGATWTRATTITGGDFAGGSLYDLMVRWSDGRVSLFPDVSRKGLGKEVQMARSGSVWKNAVQITAGQFHGGTYPTDLVVRWSDGELSLYTGVGAGTFGKEKRLLAPNATWKNAALVTSSNFSHKKNWDIVVRWADGSLDDYAGTSAAGLGVKSRLRGPSSAWKLGQVVTAGDYTANRLGDDLLVRWSDGRTTLYPDTGTRALGKETVLVYPHT